MDRQRTASADRVASDGGVHDAGESAVRRAVVLNPQSGDGSHAETVRDAAAERGYAVYETERDGHGTALATEAVADGAELVAACGGDGTVNEVVRGLDAADALGEVALGVLPAGTGNNFALNVGVESIEQGFAVLEEGERRAVDLGTANGRPFVNSCVGGLTADASSDTSSDLKERFGVLAYVVNTLRALSEFEEFSLSLADPDGEGPLWEGEAVCVLVGNARCVGDERVVPADMEDGALDVTIVEAMPPAELLETATAYRLFGDDRDAVTRLQTPMVEVAVEADEAFQFSLDGEMLRTDHLSAGVRPRACTLCVGSDYDPHPE